VDFNVVMTAEGKFIEVQGTAEGEPFTREAMDRLPEPQRQALILFADEELSYAEIAEVLGTNIGTVKSRLFHAKRTLRRLLRPETVSAIETGLRDGV